MCIFAGKYRPVVVRPFGNVEQMFPPGVLCPLLLGAFRYARIEIFLSHTGVKPTQDIHTRRVGVGISSLRPLPGGDFRCSVFRLCSLVRRLCPLVMHEACRVKSMEPTGHCSVVHAVSALVAKAPEHHRRMILVAFGHANGAIHESRCPIGRGSERPSQTMRFAVGLVHNIDANTVAKLIPARHIGIMACSHSVDISLFHQPKITLHHLLRHHTTQLRVELMSVDPTETHLPAVDEQSAVAYLQRAETYFLLHLFHCVACGILQPERECI